MNERDALTNLVVAVMLKTGERIGNSDSAENGHFGVTVLNKSHVFIKGNTVALEYIGKSGMRQEKSFSDEIIAKSLKRAIRQSPSKYIFCTSDGFQIRADRVNKFLKNFGISGKDIRGFFANKLVVEKLKLIKPEETDKKRKKQLNKILKSVAEKVGHGRPTLKKHYLIPELWDEWVNNGRVINLADLGYLEKGGEAKAEKEISTPDSVIRNTFVNYYGENGGLFF